MLAVKNIRHQKFRYVFIFLIALFTNLLIFSSLIITKQARDGIQTAKNRLGADLVVTGGTDGSDVTAEDILFNGVPSTVRLDRDIEDKIRNIRDSHITDMVSRLYVSTLSGMSCCDGQIQLIATDIGNDFLLSAFISTDRLEADEIVMGSRLGVSEGDTVQYFGREFRVVEVIEKTNTGMDTSGFISFETARGIMEDERYRDGYFPDWKDGDISMLFISSDNPKVTNNIIKSVLGNEVTVYAVDKKISEYTGSVGIIDKITAVLTVFLIIIGFISLSALSVTGTALRKNEVGCYLVIGMDKKRIYRLFISEQVIVVLSGTFLAILLSVLCTTDFGTWIEQLLNLPMSIDTDIIFLISILIMSGSLLIAVFSAMIGVSVVLRDSPCDLIKENN